MFFPSGDLMSTKQTTDLTTQTEILKKFYTDLNQNNISAIIAVFDPDIERIEPKGFPAAGTYRGHSEVEAHFVKGRSTWAEGGCFPQQFRAFGNKIAVSIHVKVKLKANLEWVEGDVVDVFTFRNLKIIEMRTFAEEKEALDWAQRPLT